MSCDCVVRVVQNPTYARVVADYVQSPYLLLNPSPIYTLTGVTSIVVTDGYRKIRLASSGGLVKNIAIPCIEIPPIDGTFCLLVGTSDTNYIEIPDELDVPGNLMRLAGGRNMILGKNDSLPITYDGDQGKWVECFGRVDSY